MREIYKCWLEQMVFKVKNICFHCQVVEHVEQYYGKERKFQHSWLNSFPGLVYSSCTNGGFCTGNLHIKASWKLSDSYWDSVGSFYRVMEYMSHINAVADSTSFIDFMEKKVQPVDNYLWQFHYKANWWK